jgi:hypothetical protein
MLRTDSGKNFFVAAPALPACDARVGNPLVPFGHKPGLDMNAPPS